MYSESDFPKMEKGTLVSGNGVSVHCTEQRRRCCGVCGSKRLWDVCNIIHLCGRTAGETSKKWEGWKRTLADGLDSYWTTDLLAVTKLLFIGHGTVCGPNGGKGRWAACLTENGHQWDACLDQTWKGLSVLLWFLHPWRYSQATWTWSWAAWSGWFCGSRRWARGSARLPVSLSPLVSLGKVTAFKNLQFGLVCLYLPKSHTWDAAFGIFPLLASNSSGHSLGITKMCAKMCKALANYDVLINFSRQVWQFWWILIFSRLGAAGKRNKFSAWVASVAEHQGVAQHLLDFAWWRFQVWFAASNVSLQKINWEQLQMSYEC